MGADRADVAARLDAWSANPPGLELHIWVIQPGLSQTTMTGWTEGQTLILAALEWCVTQGAVLHIVGSA
jgi:hypothetical protein